jgi:hypothetical protein
MRQALERFCGQKAYYRLEPEDFQRLSKGTLCWAWSVCHEAWQCYGQPSAQARVHFSKVLTKSAQSWQGLLYYRDIQPLTDAGRCPRHSRWCH